MKTISHLISLFSTFFLQKICEKLHIRFEPFEKKLVHSLKYYIFKTQTQQDMTHVDINSETNSWGGMARSCYTSPIRSSVLVCNGTKQLFIKQSKRMWVTSRIHGHLRSNK